MNPEPVLFTAKRKPGETVQRWVSVAAAERLRAVYEVDGYRVTLVDTRQPQEKI